MRKYLHNLLVASDQWVNALFSGWADETVSAHAHRLYRDGKPWGWVKAPIDWLFAWQGPEHCRQAYESELRRMQSPPEYRTDD